MAGMVGVGLMVGVGGGVIVGGTEPQAASRTRKSSGKHSLARFIINAPPGVALVGGCPCQSAALLLRYWWQKYHRSELSHECSISILMYLIGVYAAIRLLSSGDEEVCDDSVG